MFSFAKLQFSACIMLYLNQYHQYGKEDWKSVSQEAASLWVSVSSTSSALFTVCASFNIYALSSWRHSLCASQQERIGASFFHRQASGVFIVCACHLLPVRNAGYIMGLLKVKFTPQRDFPLRCCWEKTWGICIHGEDQCTESTEILQFLQKKHFVNTNIKSNHR